MRAKIYRAVAIEKQEDRNTAIAEKVKGEIWLAAISDRRPTRARSYSPTTAPRCDTSIRDRGTPRRSVLSLHSSFVSLESVRQIVSQGMSTQRRRDCHNHPPLTALKLIRPAIDFSNSHAGSCGSREPFWDHRRRSAFCVLPRHSPQANRHRHSPQSLKLFVECANMCDLAINLLLGPRHALGFIGDQIARGRAALTPQLCVGRDCVA